MIYYKISQNGKIIGVGYTPDLRKVQAKHRILITSDENDAEYIQIGEELYRDNWFAAPKYQELPYQVAKITTIDKEEYDSIKEAMQQDEEIFDEPEETTPPEESAEEDTVPEETLPSARERLKQLEEQVESLQETNDMLTECLLEMSEIVYGG